MFSLEDSSSNMLTGNDHPSSGKILYVEEKDLKLTKNQFSGYGILTIHRKSHFSTMEIGNNYNKVYIARNYTKRCK